MSNNKQQTAVERFSNQAHELFEQYSESNFDRITLNKLMLQATEKAKEMHRQQAIRLHYEYELHVMMNESDVMTFGQFYEQTYGDDKQ